MKQPGFFIDSPLEKTEEVMESAPFNAEISSTGGHAASARILKSRKLPLPTALHSNLIIKFSIS